MAIQVITNKLFPCGFDISENAPDSLESLTDHINKTGRMLVWNGKSDHSIYADKEINYCFRAWHDFHHWRHQLPFDFNGEWGVCDKQKADICTLYGYSDRARKMLKIIQAEVCGQARYKYEHGFYPENQRAFIVAYMENSYDALRAQY